MPWFSDIAEEYSRVRLSEISQRPRVANFLSSELSYKNDSFGGYANSFSGATIYL
jgi:hypothetical protein